MLCNDDVASVADSDVEAVPPRFLAQGPHVDTSSHVPVRAFRGRPRDARLDPSFDDSERRVADATSAEYVKLRGRRDRLSAVEAVKGQSPDQWRARPTGRLIPFDEALVCRDGPDGANARGRDRRRSDDLPLLRSSTATDGNGVLHRPRTLTV